MKKIKSFLFATSIFTLGLTSCSSDDNSTNGPDTSNLIVGKWNLEAIDVKVSVDGELYQEYFDMPISPQIMTFDFKKDNTVEYYYFSPETENEEPSEIRLQGTYTREGNSLVITIENEPGHFTILLSDLNNLHLGIVETFTEQGMEIKQEVVQKFARVY